MVTELEKVAEAIVQKHGTVHAFCAAHDELNRTTVYQVLNGSYKGNVGRQLARIKLVLNGSASGATSTPGELEEVIREAACSRCPLSHEATICARCAPLFTQQAQAVWEHLRRRQGGTP